MDAKLIMCLIGSGGFAWHNVMRIVDLVKAMINGDWDTIKDGPTADMRKEDIAALLVTVATCLPFIIDQIPDSVFDWLGVKKSKILKDAGADSTDTDNSGGSNNPPNTDSENQTLSPKTLGLLALLLFN